MRRGYISWKVKCKGILVFLLESDDNKMTAFNIFTMSQKGNILYD